MMDRRTIREQQLRVDNLAAAATTASRRYRASRAALRQWSAKVGSTEGLAGAFLAGGLVGLKSAPEKPARIVCTDGDAVDLDGRSDGAMMRWLNTGLLLWRLYAASADQSASPLDSGA